jgi:hypothetical protein
MDISWEKEGRKWYADARLIILAIFFAASACPGQPWQNTFQYAEAQKLMHLLGGKWTIHQHGCQPVYEGLSHRPFRAGLPVFCALLPALAEPAWLWYSFFAAESRGAARQFCFAPAGGLALTLSVYLSRQAVGAIFTRSVSFGR